MSFVPSPARLLLFLTPVLRRGSPREDNPLAEGSLLGERLFPRAPLSLVAGRSTAVEMARRMKSCLSSLRCEWPRGWGGSRARTRARQLVALRSGRPARKRISSTASTRATHRPHPHVVPRRILRHFPRAVRSHPAATTPTSHPAR